MTVLDIFEHLGSEDWLRTVLNHNLNLSSFSQLLLLCVEGLSAGGDVARRRASEA